MDGMNVKSLEERSEGDVASPSSTGTQVQSFFCLFVFLATHMCVCSIDCSPCIHII